MPTWEVPLRARNATPTTDTGLPMATRLAGWRPIEPCTHDEPWSIDDVDWTRATDPQYHAELAYDLRHLGVVPIWTDAHCDELATLAGALMQHCTTATPEGFRAEVMRRILQAEVDDDGHVILTRETPMQVAKRAVDQLHDAYRHTPLTSPRAPSTPPTVGAQFKRRRIATPLPWRAPA